MDIFDYCVMSNRLTVIYNHERKFVSLCRCCYLKPFADFISLKEFLNIKDLIQFAEEKSKTAKPERLSEYANWCTCDCGLNDKIKIVTVSFSRACNLNCYHCFYDEHKDAPYIKEIQFKALKMIKGHQLEKLHLLSTGEVFIYYDKLVKYLRSLTVNDFKEIDFQSNITLLSKERIEELKQISEETGVKYLFSPSIDGITKETYEAVRIGASWEKVTKNLGYLCDVFTPDNIFINFTLKKPNFEDLPNVNQFFKEKFNIDHVQINPDIFDEKAFELLKNF